MKTYDRDRRITQRQKMLLVALSICGLLAGCHNPATVWSTEVRSPDGLWIAIAQRDQFSGPGNAAVYTTVYLKRTAGRTDPMEILLFNENEGPTDLKMNWLTPSHLEVTYKQPVIIDFQAVKCGGVEISLRDLSDGTRRT